jgi:hypothetical protein
MAKAGECDTRGREPRARIKVKTSGVLTCQAYQAADLAIGREGPELREANLVGNGQAC